MADQTQPDEQQAGSKPRPTPTSQTLRTPFFSRHIAAGAKMVPFAGFSMPVTFTSIKAEHHAVRRNVGLFDVSHMGEIRVRGPRAVSVVNGLISQDLRKTKCGQARYSVLCNPSGGVVDDLLAYKVSEEDILLCVNASNRNKDFAFLTQHAKPGATVTQESDQWAQLALQGPNAQRLLQTVSDADLEAIGYYRFAFTEVAGVRLLVSRTGYTGEDGFELYVPSNSALPVYDAITEKGKDFDLALCGLGCRDTLRLEARMPLHGQDLDDTTNPLEAGLSFAVKLDKPEDFPGKAALERIKSQGVRRRLRGFILQDRGVPRPHYGIFAGGEQVGELTSGSYSPTLDVGIGLGYIDVRHAEATVLEIEIRRRRVPATVTRKPFYTRETIPTG